jgi:hypothetical protein
MPRPDYRELAGACVRLAEEVIYPSTRASLLQIAQAWLRLHDLAEKNSQADPVDEQQSPQSPDR